jgi:hypothetical protein
LKQLAAWAQEKPGEQRYQFLSGIQKKLGLLKDARNSLVKAREISDPTRKLDLAIQIANSTPNRAISRVRKSPGGEI